MSATARRLNMVLKLLVWGVGPGRNTASSEGSAPAMSYRNSVAAWTSHRNTEAPTCVVPVALSIAMGLAAVGALSLSEPAHAGPSDPTHVRFCDTTISGGLNVLDRSLRCDVSPALTVTGGILDLRNHTLICAPDEKGNIGTGILVMESGATVRNGKIKNCTLGVLVEGDGNHRLEHLTVTSPRLDDGEYGIQVTSNYNVLDHNIVIHVPDVGIRLDSGASYNVVKYNKAIKNGSHGFEVQDGQNNYFLWNEARRNDEEGFRSRERNAPADGNLFVRNTAKDNGDDGIRIRANENRVIGNIVKRNGLVPCDPSPDVDDTNAGIAITNDGSRNTIVGNKSEGNCVGVGIDEQEGDVPLENKIVGNLSRKNTLVDMADLTEDCDDNKWFRNIFKSSAAGPDLEESPPCIQ
jgi:parallel beta-helix repeat protein